MVVVAPQHDVVAVAAVECLAVVALNQDVGVTEVDVAEYQLDVAAVVVVAAAVQVQGVVTETAVVAEPAIDEVAQLVAQHLAVHDNMAGVVAETFVEAVTSCVVVEGLYDVAATVVVVVAADAENVEEPLAAEQEALATELAFDVEER